MAPELAKALLWNARIRMRKAIAQLGLFDFLELRDLATASTGADKLVNGKTMMVNKLVMDVKHKRSWYELEKFILASSPRFTPIVDSDAAGRIGKAFVTRIAPNTALYLVRISSTEAQIVVAHRFSEQLTVDTRALWLELCSELPIQGFPQRTKF